MSVLSRPLLTVRQVADQLQVSERTIRRLVDQGKLPAVRLGGPRSRVRIDRDELEEWLRSSHVTPPSAASPERVGQSTTRPPAGEQR